MNDTITLASDAGISNHTIVHPLGLLVVLVLGTLMLFLPRRYAVQPMLIMACFIPSAQRIVIAGLDFGFIRILVLCGILRIYILKENKQFVWRPLDFGIIIWAACSIVLYTARIATFSSLINRLGFAFDACGMYFLFRCLLCDWEDVKNVVYGFVLISIPVAMFFFIENQTGHNFFSVFGGVPSITTIRDEKLRCQGAFSHAILAGCFWASLMPLFGSLWWKSAKDRAWAITGFLTSLFIVYCCASSTPVMGVLSGIIGAMFFYLRYRMRIVRWLLLLVLISLHIVMKAPVWHLISRVSAVGGSTGWHRYNLINQAINHFDEWFLYGCSGMNIYDWGVYAGDVTNQYILEGVNGGFLTMCMFVAIIVMAFREVGKLWRFYIGYPFRLAFSWALGVSLFVHCMNFIGVSYFGQTTLVWYLSLAMITSLSAQIKITGSANQISPLNSTLQKYKVL